MDSLANGALGWAVAAGDAEYLASARHLGLDGVLQAGGVLSSAAADIVLTGRRIFGPYNENGFLSRMNFENHPSKMYLCLPIYSC